LCFGATLFGGTLSPEQHSIPDKRAQQLCDTGAVLIFTRAWGMVMVNAITGAEVATKTSTIIR
jgi:hypothetical protein